MPRPKADRSVNDFVVPSPNVNGSGFGRAPRRRTVAPRSAQACRSSPRNSSPLQHPGPATWIRGAVTDDAISARAARRSDVAINPQTWDDLAS